MLLLLVTATTLVGPVMPTPNSKVMVLSSLSIIALCGVADCSPVASTILSSPVIFHPARLVYSSMASNGMDGNGRGNCLPRPGGPEIPGRHITGWRVPGWRVTD
jgi:hypothetical protein